jgi:hypothetical protein
MGGRRTERDWIFGIAAPVIVNRVEGVGKSIDRTPELVSFNLAGPAIEGTTGHFFVFPWQDGSMSETIHRTYTVVGDARISRAPLSRNPLQRFLLFGHRLLELRALDRGALGLLLPLNCEQAKPHYLSEKIELTLA